MSIAAPRCVTSARRWILALGCVLALAACAPTVQHTSPTHGASDAGQSAPHDPATLAACETFFGTPPFEAPLAYDTLAYAINASAAGGGDFFASHGQDLATHFEHSTSDVRTAGDALAQWFENNEQDMAVFEERYRALGSACAPMTVAAAWESGALNEPGTKPATLVCSEIVAQPQALTHLHTSNVLPSEMFYMVGLAPRWVNEQDLPAIEHTRDQLQTQIDRVDDDGVRSALMQIQAPFESALNGDLNSPGLSEPMREFGRACEAAGFAGAVEVPAEHEDTEYTSGEGELP